MNRLPRRVFPATLLALLCLCMLISAQEFGRSIPSGYLDAGPIHKVIIPSSNLEKLDQLRGQSALVDSIDYGSFTLAFVTETAWSSRALMMASDLDFHDEFDLMVFNGYRINGLRPLEYSNAIPLDMAYGNPSDVGLPDDAGLFVVQFRGPVKDEWLKELTAIGTQVIQFAPTNGYVVRSRGDKVSLLEQLQATSRNLQFVGAYHPAYKLRSSLREIARDTNDREVHVTIQVVRSPDLAESQSQVESLMSQVDSAEAVGPYVNLRGMILSSRIHAVTHHKDVFALEPLGTRTKSDERQGQIIAGNFSGGQPNGPGYLSWLASMGFNSSQFSSFAVNVVDDATSLLGHPDLANNRVAFTINPTGQTGSQAGHGFLNAHIVAGMNNGTGSAVEDALGYNYGLGIAPWAQVGSTAIFGGGTATPTSWENTAYSQGSRISTNSWNFQSGIQQNPIPTYDINSQEYDFIVRDARSGVSGNQEYMVLFSAANNGPQANTVSTPTTAKNILSVGASENFRPTGTDGCGISNSGADNLNDVISFSSRGPVDDGRWKPEIVAPGTHVQAGVPQSNYNGTGVCDQYFPFGQTLYGWSSGTSHSTPAVAGGAALVRQWFLNNSMPAPSPAMTKAMIISGAEYMTGVSSNDTLPSNNQGMGFMNLGRTFDSGSKVLLDQTTVLGGTGASHQVTGSIAATNKPFRVTLAWTDAPGTSSSAPWVNNLDLTVVIGGNTYRGNVFSGSSSVTGGSADFRNNVESVFLPAGVSGSFTITVTGSSIGGDGIPGNGDATDQDFALVVLNGSTVSAPPTAAFSGSPVSGTAPLAVTFADQSTGTISSWSWNFGDGNMSTAPNPTHVYAVAGTYDVSLTVTGSAGSDTLTKVGYITATNPPPPSAPSGLGASAISTSQIDLSWNDNANNEDGFIIENSLDGVSFSFLASVGDNVTSYSDFGLLEDTDYWYRVEAFNGSGNSGFSNTAMATTLIAGSTDYRVTSDLSGQGTASGTSVDTQADDGQTHAITERSSGGKPANRHSFLTWTWGFDVAPAGSLTFIANAWHSVSTDSDDFVLSWSSDNVNFTNMFTVTNTSDGNPAQSFALPANLNGTIYVRVQDTDQTQGNRALDTFFMDDMLIRAAGAGMFPPIAPNSLSASASSATSIDVTWSDNSSDEDGFELERSTDGVNFSLLTTKAANVTSHADAALTPGQTYFYRVRAFNSNGNSNYSNTSSATPGGSGSVDDFALSESTIDGNIQSGSLASTQTADGLNEQIRERRTGGSPSQRRTMLEHNWTFSVTGGSSVTFHLNALQSVSSDNDNFDFSYSVDGGSSFQPMFTVSNTTDIGVVTFGLPPSTSGTVIVKVVDTDRSAGGSNRDSIYVDQMFFRSQ